MSLTADLRLRCDEACEDGGTVGEERTEMEESNQIEDIGEKGRRGSVGGMDFKVGSKGELYGELGKRASLIEKVSVQDVGEVMEKVWEAHWHAANGARGAHCAAGRGQMREDDVE